MATQQGYESRCRNHREAVTSAFQRAGRPRAWQRRSRSRCSERDKTKRTLLSEECPQRARAKRRLTATRTSPEVLQRGADESRLLAPGRLTHLPSCESASGFNE